MSRSPTIGGVSSVALIREGFPVFLGWVRAIAKAQDQARKGGIAEPILILHSARSHDGTDSIWHEEYRRADESANELERARGRSCC